MERNRRMERNRKDERVVREIMKTCADLGLNVNSKLPDAKNKYLSAWHKRMDPT